MGQGHWPPELLASENRRYSEGVPETDASSSPRIDPAPSGRNTLGLAGFIVSLVGLCSGGVLSPAGLAISFAALFRRPRGLAIAGFVLGLAGSGFLVAMIAVAGTALLAAMLTGLIAGQGPLEAAVDGWRIRDAVEAYVQEHGWPPASANELAMLEPETVLDRWGREYHITIDPENGEIRMASDGADGVPATDDDLINVFEFSLPKRQ